MLLVYCCTAKYCTFCPFELSGNNSLCFPDKKIFWPALLQRPRLWNCYFFLFDTAIAKSLIWSHLDIIRSIIYERIFMYRHVSDPVMYLDLKMKMHLIEESLEHAAPSSAVSSGWWCDYPEFSWPFKKRNIVPFAKRCRPISYIEFFLPKDNAWMEQSEDSTLLTYFYQPRSG